MSSVIIFFSSKSINLPGVATTMWQPLEEGWRRDGEGKREMEGVEWRKMRRGKERRGYKV